jgi:hypothetical protein
VLTLRGESIVTDNDADPMNAESGGGIFNVPGSPARVEFFDSSRVTGNRPNDCTGATCPA